MNTTKPFEISKKVVWQAYLAVKANGGTAGIYGESISAFERNLKDNLYKIWNRMSSGTYFPPPVKGVEIPKKSGGTRLLGVPSVSDRIAQTVVKIILEPMLEPIFDTNSFGYRPNKSAHDAIAITRTRCWQYDWVVEFDIKGLFDNLDHELLLKALKHHCDCKWVLLYIERWLKAPLQNNSGAMCLRNKGTPQGGIVSPLLANLFLHYAFDAWVKRELPSIAFCRYADDGLLHCNSQRQAKYVLKRIEQRFSDCGLSLNKEKTWIIYCKDKNRKEQFDRVKFDFLGYTFRPRRCINQQGSLHPNFLPAISRVSQKNINKEIRGWHIQLKSDKTLLDISRMFNAVLIGWYNYYGRFYPSAINPVWKQVNMYLVQWMRRKYKRFYWHKRRAREYLNRIARINPHLFKHWELGIFPAAKVVGAE